MCLFIRWNLKHSFPVHHIKQELKYVVVRRHSAYVGVQVWLSIHQNLCLHVIRFVIQWYIDVSRWRRIRHSVFVRK